MYFDFNFDRDADFFKQSPSFKLVQKKLNEDKKIENFDKKLVNATLKLWAECVLKNNLDRDSDRVDPLYLFSQQNSTEVYKKIGKIIWKAKDNRTDKEWKTLTDHGIIHNSLQLNIYYLSDDKIDIFSDLKKEFITWKMADDLNKEIPINNTKSPTKKI